MSPSSALRRFVAAIFFLGAALSVEGEGPRTGKPVVRAKAPGATSAATIVEHVVPTGNFSALPSITAGPDGNLWFTEIERRSVTRLTTAGVFTRFFFPEATARPAQVVSGSDGNLWVTVTYNNGISFVGYLARVTPAGVITPFPLPWRTSVLTAGPDGNLWFAMQGKIGRLTPAGVFTEFAMPNSTGSPRGLCAGPDGNVWYTLEIGPGSYLGRVTPSGVFAEFPLTDGTEPHSCVAGPDGNIWATVHYSGDDSIVKMTPTGEVTWFGLPTVNSLPEGITAGADGALWFTESLPEANRIGRCSVTGHIDEWVVPTSTAVPYAIASGSDGNIWFTESPANTENDKIGQLLLSSVPVELQSFSAE